MVRLKSFQTKIYRIDAVESEQSEARSNLNDIFIDISDFQDLNIEALNFKYLALTNL